MHSLSLMVSCFLSAAPPPAATQPATQPAYYVSKYSTTYHMGDCAMLPADDRRVAKPGELRAKQPCKFCVREPAGEDGAAPTTQPAITAIGKYYNLVKNEFIKEPDGAIELTLPDLQQAIAGMRESAAEEKKLVDQDIAALTREIQAADRERKESLKQERESKADARRHAARAESYSYEFNSGGYRTYRHRDSLEQYHADSAKDEARSHRQDASRAKGDVSALRVELLELKRASAVLAAVASPTSRNLPPREFWKDLPAEQREQLESVGISQDEFKDLLARLGQTEDAFVAAARGMEKDARSTDQMVRRLRDYFEGQLGPRRPPRRPAATPPAGNKPAAAPAPTRP